MRRHTALALAALALVAVTALLGGAASALAASPSSGCRATITSRNWRAVLGHEPTAARATASVKAFLKLGYKGTKVEIRGCGDYAVVIESPEFSKFQVRNAFALENARAKLVVSYARPPATAAKPGDVVVVFGHTPTLAQAVALLKKVAASGWRETDIGYGGPHDWRVVWPGVPGAKADQIVKDTYKLGYLVELELA